MKEIRFWSQKTICLMNTIGLSSILSLPGGPQEALGPQFDILHLQFQH